MDLVWKNRVTDLLSVRTILVSLLPSKCAQVLGMPFKLPRFLLKIATSSVVLARKFLIQTWQVRKSSSSIGFFDLGYLQSWGRSLRFWSLHLSLGLVVSPEWVVSMRFGTHHLLPCLLNRRFLSILMWFWLELLLSRVCRMGWAFQPFWGYNFWYFTQPRYRCKAFFDLRNLSIKETLNFPSLRWDSFWWNCSS